MKTRHPRAPTYLAVITWLLLSAGVNDLRAQGTAFAFQGRLSDNGSPANGEYDLNCSLFDAATSGTQIGFSVTNAPLSVSNGLFTTLLDFGSSAFSGPARWLQIAVRTNGSAGAYTTLLPRPPISAVPYSITAGNLTGPVADAQLSSNIPRLNASQAFSGELSASSFAGSGAGLTGLNASQLSSGTVPTAALGNAWQLGGNSGTAPGANFVGTTDDQAFELKVNGVRALRLEPNSTSPNLVGGWFGNSVYPGLNGVTISGGGQDGYGLTNQATAGADNSVIGGGYGNTASAANVTIGGGAQNTASGQYATVPGGVANTAAGFTSFAAGRQAKASHDGAFVWADSTAEDFASTSNNQFLIRASGGVGIGKNNPAGALDVNGTVTATSFSGSGAGLTNLNAVAKTGDTMTGILNLPVNGLKAGSNQLVLTGGNVGIGTNAPTAPLHVNGYDANGSTAKFERGSPGEKKLWLRAIAGERVIFASEGAFAFNTAASDAGQGNELLRIATNGFVGLGTNAPASPLHVVGYDPNGSTARFERGLAGEKKLWLRASRARE